MTSAPKRKMTLATFGKLLLCLYACALVYRYHRNTSHSGEDIRLRREAIQRKNLSLIEGPHQPVSDGIEFVRTDLGNSMAIGFADDGTLLYSKTEFSKSRHGETPNSIYVRKPNGQTRQLPSRASGILADGRIVQQMDKEIQIDGKPLALTGATNPNLGTEYFGSINYRDAISSAGSNFILADSYYIALISSNGAVTEIRSFVPTDESAWIAAGRTFLLFDPIHRNSFPESLQLSASGTVYGMNSENTQLYNNWGASVRVPYKSTGGPLTPISMPEGFRPDYDDPEVGLDDSVVVHYRDPHNLQYWPHFLKQGKIIPIPLPEGTTSGRVLAVADRSTMVLQCGTTSYGGGLYLLKEDRLYRVGQLPGEATSDLRVPGDSSGDSRLQGRRWISKTGAFVALDKEKAYLFEPRLKTKSP